MLILELPESIKPDVLQLSLSLISAVISVAERLYFSTAKRSNSIVRAGSSTPSRSTLEIPSKPNNLTLID